MKINAGMLVALGIHILITILFFLDKDYFFLGFLGLAVVSANVIGILLIKFNMQAGYKIFMFSGVVLMPIGLIGAISARKELDKLTENKFNESLKN